jgi:uncharacterized membrane protein
VKIESYRKWRVAIIALVGCVAAVAVIIGNTYVLIGGVVVGMLALLLLRRGVTQVVHDERNYTIAYRAARLTMAITGVGMALSGAILITLNRHSLASTPAQIGFALEYVTCGLLIINVLAYSYYNRKYSG